MILGIIAIIIVSGIAVFSINPIPTNNDVSSDGEIITNSMPKTNNLKIIFFLSVYILNVYLVGNKSLVLLKELLKSARSVKSI